MESYYDTLMEGLKFFAGETGFTILKTNQNQSSITILCTVQDTFSFNLWIIPRSPYYNFTVRNAKNHFYSSRPIGKVRKTYNLEAMKKDLLKNITLNLLDVMNL